MTKQEKYIDFIVADLIGNTRYWLNTGGNPDPSDMVSDVTIEFPYHNHESYYDIETIEVIIMNAIKHTPYLDFHVVEYFKSRYGAKGEEIADAFNRYRYSLGKKIMGEYTNKLQKGT